MRYAELLGYVESRALEVNKIKDDTELTKWFEVHAERLEEGDERQIVKVALTIRHLFLPYYRIESLYLWDGLPSQQDPSWASVIRVSEALIRRLGENEAIVDAAGLALEAIYDGLPGDPLWLIEPFS